MNLIHGLPCNAALRWGEDIRLWGGNVLAEGNFPGDPTRGPIDETDAETETFKCVGITDTAATASSIGRARNLIHKPAPGEIIVVGAAPGQRHVINFNTSAAQVRVEGDNLILIFKDDGRIVFENLAALAQSQNAPVFAIAGREVPGGALFGKARAFAGGEIGPKPAATLETVARAVRTPGRDAAESSDDPKEGQDVMDVNDILIGPEGLIPVPSGGRLILDTSDDAGGDPGAMGTLVEVGFDNSAGGEFLPDTLVAGAEFTLDYPARRFSWSNGPLTDSGLKSDPRP